MAAPAGRPAVFFDRDGTLNEDTGYVGEPARLRLLDGACEAVRMVRAAGLACVVVTNQSGVARGMFDEEAVRAVHARLEALLAESDAYLDGIYYCPHHPEARVEAYRRACPCRKPAPGMLHRAGADLELDLSRSFVVGDKVSDMQAAKAVGARGVRVYADAGVDDEATFRAEDIFSAAQWILSRLEA